MRRDPLGPAARARLGGDVLREVVGGDEEEPARDTSPAAPAPSRPPAEPSVPTAEEEGRAKRPSRAAGTSGGGKRARGATTGGRTRRAAARPAPEVTGKRVAFSVRIPDDLLERARDAAFWQRAVLNDLFTEGLALRLELLEKEHGPIKPRAEDLRPGRKFK